MTFVTTLITKQQQKTTVCLVTHFICLDVYMFFFGRQQTCYVYSLRSPDIIFGRGVTRVLYWAPPLPFPPLCGNAIALKPHAHIHPAHLCTCPIGCVVVVDGFALIFNIFTFFFASYRPFLNIFIMC